MKKHTTLLYACMACTAILQLSSCIKPHDPHNPFDADNTYDGCRVKQTVNQSTDESIIITRNFSYNSNNDPVSVNSPQVSTGNPNLVFKYDDKCRLIEYSGLYTNGLFEFVHKYGYTHNRITIDTQYVFGTYATLSGYYGLRYKYLSYDHLDRIVQDSEVFVLPGAMINVINYSYDASGNLINGKTYDTKLNPHRTNKVWMFVDRDYSVNNSVAAATYNSSGLPTSFTPPTSTFDLAFGYVFYFGSTQIFYDCK